MSIAIEVKNVSHSFKYKKICDNININFEENKIYGLLGKNGAGKTTLINIIVNQLLCNHGEVKIFGKNPNEDIRVLDDICIVREREFYDIEYKVKDIFKAYFYFYKDYDYKLQEKLCKRFEINQKLSYKKLSRGMKTLVSNIIGICSNSPITIFDEPTIGLDEVNREEFYSILLESYTHKNRTIIISTHQINEVEQLLEKVIIIKNGKVEVDDYIDEVKEKSYHITGKKEDLNKLSILKNRSPIKSFGNNEVYSYYGEINDQDLALIETLNIELDNMSIQDLFINMNNPYYKFLKRDVKIALIVFISIVTVNVGMSVISNIISALDGGSIEPSRYFSQASMLACIMCMAYGINCTVKTFGGVTSIRGDRLGFLKAIALWSITIAIFASLFSVFFKIGCKVLMELITKRKYM